MKFKYRLGYYLVGFSLGLFFVAAIWSGKDTRCNYFPNARVLNDIRKKPFYYSEQASTVLAQPWIDTIDIKNTMKYGDVDFDRSNIEYQKGKLYTVEGKTMKNVPIVLQVVNYENRSLLLEIRKK